ncbi:GTP-binding protein [Paenibacillus methanolicus]|uniref:Small GTP-binding protein n=1 Tax=Paenibacillus methanolicus TaxID=582686 RepID=A0A5S5C7Q1_9BACL|nr:TetM/TetW/TetO/TetS family tetracycline resistance ribosomal protection protein [Paenibacillus methanolicus]TYP75435.1 small GTP-binding protein [Paenibacillus methanolicus]
MFKTIGMFAHVDAGKTTLAEQFLYHTKSIRERGRVDHKDAFLDSHDIERERGITVFADQAIMSYNGTTYTLIDTPGHADFSPEMERAVNVMDAAIVVLSAVEGVQGHTETVWRLLRDRGVPIFLFINKTDRTGADVDRVLAEIRRDLSPDALLLEQVPITGQWPEEPAAFLAERDEALLERYMSGNFDAAAWLTAARTMVKEGRLYPCLSGSALQDEGVRELLAVLDALIDASWEEEGAFAGRVYKIRHDPNGTRLTFAKALGGRIRVRDELAYGQGPGGSRISEKITALRLYNGTKFKPVEEVRAGQLFAAVGLSAAAAGEGLGANAERTDYAIKPTMRSKADIPPRVPAKEALRAFRLLGAEDPSLAVQWEETLQEIQLQVMGSIQLDVLSRVVRERFGFEAAFGPPQILYNETIANTVTGAGHFEPLGHYAEVHLRLEPGERGSGLQVSSECHPDMLPVQFQHLVLQHLLERDHHGLLTGSPVTDMKITLLKGKAHNKHTSGGDFREATFRALRQGLEKAGNVLLEPVYAAKIKVPLAQVGRVLSDLQQGHGRFDPPETTGEHAVITARVPVATFMHYGEELASFTQGKGTLALAFAGYDRCHDADAVIARRGYDKRADPAYSSTSIFCAKGQGYPVPWDEADAHMHV